MFRRQQKAGSLCFWAQTVSLSLSLLLPRRGTLCARKAGGTSVQLLSATQRYNTLDFATKVVCHETPPRFLWILPAIVIMLSASSVRSSEGMAGAASQFSQGYECPQKNWPSTRVAALIRLTSGAPWQRSQHDGFIGTTLRLYSSASKSWPGRTVPEASTLTAA